MPNDPIGLAIITATFNYPFSAATINSGIRDALTADGWTVAGVGSVNDSGSTVVTVNVYVYNNTDEQIIADAFTATISSSMFGALLVQPVYCTFTPRQVGGQMGGGVNVGGNPSDYGVNLPPYNPGGSNPGLNNVLSNIHNNANSNTNHAGTFTEKIKTFAESAGLTVGALGVLALLTFAVISKRD